MQAAGLAAAEAAPAVRRGGAAKLWGAVTGAVGTVSGIAPHVLHHAGPLAGAAIVSGATGSLLFAALGFVLTVPLLLRVRRRFETWKAPAVALGIFAAMFLVSTLWIGPAIRDAFTSDDGDSNDAHHQQHTGS